MVVPIERQTIALVLVPGDRGQEVNETGAPLSYLCAEFGPGNTRLLGSTSAARRHLLAWTPASQPPVRQVSRRVAKIRQKHEA